MGNYHTAARPSAYLVYRAITGQLRHAKPSGINPTSIQSCFPDTGVKTGKQVGMVVHSYTGSTLEREAKGF